MIVARKEEALRAAVATLPGESDWRVANAGDPEAAVRATAACLSRFDRIDIVVNNAGTNPHFGSLTELTSDKATKTMLVNQLGPVVWAAAAVRAGMGDHGGSVINVSSVGGSIVEENIGWYNATKAALDHLTRQLAYELGPKVRVNAVAPGLVKTDMARALWEPMEAELAARLPLRRLGEPQDVANLAVFLASDLASWITGQTFVIDGGLTALPA